MDVIDQIETDNELFLLVRDHNDGEAFSALYQRYHKRIFAYCLRIVRDEGLARDAFQNTFSAVYEQRAQFQPGEFSRWLFTIAKRQAMRVYSRYANDRVSADVEHDTLAELVDEDAPDGEGQHMAALVRKAVNELPPDFRDVITLRYFEDLPYQDIADRLNITLSLAKVRVNRAKTQLQQILNLNSEDVL